MSLPKESNKDQQPDIPIHTMQNNINEIQKQSDDQILMQIIRIRALEKQKYSKQLWQLSDKQLQQFFFTYKLYDGLDITMKQLLQSKNIKLVKNENRFYFGEVVDNKKHGIGINIYKDQKIYQGSFLNNQRHGLGYQIYQNGNVYIGQYQQNKKHGLGSFYWFTIGGVNQKMFEFYQGEWWSGLPSGKGMHRRSNGDIYEGDFKNGLKHGQGEEVFQNGDIYKGDYINGLPEGYGQYIWKDGSNYKGDFKQGVRNGFGIWRLDNKGTAQSYRGHYLMDRKTGYGVYTWPNGDYYKGEFFQDLRHGNGQLYNNNKLVYRGTWIQGKQAPNAKPKRKNNHLNESKNAKTKQLKQYSIRNASNDDVYDRNSQYSNPKDQILNKKFSRFRNYTLQSKELNQSKLKPVKKPRQNQYQYYDSSSKKHKTQQVNQSYISPSKPKNKQNSFVQNHHSHGRVGHKNCIPTDPYINNRKYKIRIPWRP